MQGAELVKKLKAQLGVTTDTALAGQLELTPGRISQIKTADDVSVATVAKLVEKVASAHKKGVLGRAIQPVVEFFPIDACQSREGGRNVPFDTTIESGKNLRRALKETHGIYAFYNSQAEIIYFGKAKKLSLYDEIVNVFNREIPNFTVFRVRHPWGRYKSADKNELRKIKRESVYLYDAASYFSAYSVHDDLINDIEAFFIRMAPNDIINVRMERSKLQAFSAAVT